MSGVTPHSCDLTQHSLPGFPGHGTRQHKWWSAAALGFILAVILCQFSGCATISFPVEWSAVTAGRLAIENEAAITHDLKRDEPSETAGLDEEHPLRVALAEDHWIAQDLWPEPVAGPRELLRRGEEPQARWQHNVYLKQYLESPAQLDLLLELAAEDSLAGWNACLLVAWESKQPVSSKILDRLEELVLSPPKYFSENGQRQPTELPKQDLMLSSADDTMTENNTLRSVLRRLWGGNLPESSQVENPTEELTAAKQKEEKPQAANSLSESFRAAAAEAWCYALSRKQGDPEILFASAGIALTENELPESVRAELMRGIARCIPPRRIPGLNEILQDQEQASVPTPAALSALDACLAYALYQSQRDESSIVDHTMSAPEQLVTFDLAALDPKELWPEALWEYRWKEDPEVVKRIGLWLALVQHPLAEGYLKQQLQHVEVAVQWQALRDLGLLQSEAVQSFLLTQATQREGIPRAIAVRAAGDWNADTIYSYLTDSSSYVRTMVARYAASQQGPEAARKLMDLVNDPDPVVQKEAVAGVEKWSDEDAFAVLAEGFRSTLPPTRKLARQQLEKRFDIVIASLEDSPAQRAQILETIAQRHRLTTQPRLLEGLTDVSIANSPAIETLANDEDRQKQVELLTQLNDVALPESLRGRLRQDLQALLQQKPGLLDEDLLQLHNQALRQRVALYADLQFSRCEDLQALQRGDLHGRRHAARRLAVEGQKHRLQAWQLRLLAEQMKQEQDVNVCRDLLQAISGNTTAEAREVAIAALLHPWPDVRILGCRYVEQERLPQLAPFLLPLLQERNSLVQMAAIRAAGRCRNPLVLDGQASEEPRVQNSSTPQPREGLRALLGTVPQAAEFEVIAGMARLGDEQGLAELRKLSYASQPELRGQAISLMGELGQKKHLEHLVRLGWTESHAAVRAAILASLDQLVPEGERPDLSKAFTYEAKIELWSAWQEQQVGL